MTTIQTQDLGFLALEARGTPMHIGFLLRFRLPERAARDFMQKLHDSMARCPVDRAPFKQRAAEATLNAAGMLAIAALPPPRTDQTAARFTNLTNSNLPGPRDALYLRGAELLAMYPVSVLPGDHRLNITVLSYRDQQHVGLIGCPDGLPSLQKIAAGLTQALQELEIAVQAATGDPPPIRRHTTRTR